MNINDYLVRGLGMSGVVSAMSYYPCGPYGDIINLLRIKNKVGVLPGIRGLY